MALALARSFEKVRDKIKDSGSYWIQGFNGLWYHTFDKKKVSQRLMELNLEIDYHNGVGNGRLKSEWDRIPGTSNT